MTAGRLRSISLVVSLCLALMLATSLAWVAQGAAKPKPTPGDRTANIQLLGVNDFHGNLEPIPNATYRTPTDNIEGRPITCNGGPAGGAAFLDAYLDQYASSSSGSTIRVHAGDMVGASPLISSYFHDEPTIKATNLMEFDVGTLGNHEFDEGGKEMLSETAEMKNKAVDAIVAGHSHSYLNTTVNGKLIVEAFSLGTAFDTVNLAVSRKTGDVIKSSARVVPTCNADMQPDAETAALVAHYDQQITPIESRVIGTAATDITRAPAPASDITLNGQRGGESALGDLIADAQREYAGTQIAFMNPGGIRQDIQAGEV